MKQDRRMLPEFVQEALEDESDVDLEAIERLAELVEPSKRVVSSERLLRAVAEPPLRYAPFFSRLEALWDLSGDDVVRALERAKSVSAYRRTPLPGVRVIELTGGPRTRGAHVNLVHFAPGTRFPRHRHPGPETALVLEGSYVDSSGRSIRAGDLHEMDPDSEHGFVVTPDGPCVLAIVQYGLEFKTPLLRVLNKLFRRRPAGSKG